MILPFNLNLSGFLAKFDSINPNPFVPAPSQVGGEIPEK